MKKHWLRVSSLRWKKMFKQSSTFHSRSAQNSFEKMSLNSNIFTRSFFFNFVESLEQINIYRNTRLIALHRVPIYLFVYKSLHFFLLTILPLSCIGRIILFDAFYHWVPSVSTDLYAACYAAMSAYHYHLFFFRNDLRSNQLLRSILYHSDLNGFFIYQSYKGRNVCRVIQRFHQVINNFLGWINTIGGMNLELL